jgi:hypothetical protein
MMPCRLKNGKLFGLVLILSALGAVPGCNGIKAQPAQAGSDSVSPPPFAGVQSIEIPRGTEIYVRLREGVSSATAAEGQSFSAVLDEPLSVGEDVLVPQGSPVSGRVVAARQSGHLHEAGYLRLTLSTVTVGGKAVLIQTSSIFVKGGSYRNHKLGFVGGGTGRNTLLDALIGGGKVVGGESGDGGGASGYAIGKNEVGFVAESRLGFRLIESVQMEK